MSLVSSPSPSRRHHQHDGFSSELHDQLRDLHDGGEVSTLPTSLRSLSDLVDPPNPGPPCPPDPPIQTGFDPPYWSRLIRSPLGATDDRISLIATILSNRGEAEMVEHLCEDDAQAFIDIMREVSSRILSPSKDGPIDSPRTPRPTGQTLDHFDQTKRMSCLRFLCKTCGHHSLLPRSLIIPVSYDRTKDPLYEGGFARVWKGVSGDREVAVKVLKLYTSCNQERLQKCRSVGD